MKRKQRRLRRKVNSFEEMKRRKENVANSDDIHYLSIDLTLLETTTRKQFIIHNTISRDKHVGIILQNPPPGDPSTSPKRRGLDSSRGRVIPLPWSYVNRWITRPCKLEIGQVLNSVPSFLRGVQRVLSALIIDKNNKNLEKANRGGLNSSSDWLPYTIVTFIIPPPLRVPSEDKSLGWNPERVAKMIPLSSSKSYSLRQLGQLRGARKPVAGYTFEQSGFHSRKYIILQFPMKTTQLFVPTNEAVTFDDILVYLGKYDSNDYLNMTRNLIACEFSTYQMYLFGTLTAFCLFLVFVYFTQSFLTVLPTEYWCKLPQLKGLTNETIKEIMIPSSKVVPYEGHQLPYSRCWMYDLPVEKALAMKKPDASWPLKRCNDWEYKLSFSDVPYVSVAAEMNWVCDNAYKSTLAESIFFVGSVFGCLTFGWLADKYGRIPALVGTNMLGFIGGVSTAFVTQFWQFCLCRFIVGLAYDNTFVLAYILVLEYIGPSHRTFVANMSYGIFFTVGGVCLPWMAHGIASWRNLALVTSVPLILAVAAPFLIPESVRWLITQGEIEKALKIIARIEKVNNTHIPRDIYEEFIDDCIETADMIATENHRLVDVFRTKRLRNMMVLLTVSWGLIQMIYDGHIRSLNVLGVDIFTTFTIASATEMPAMMFITYTLDILGRRWSLFGSTVISGLFGVLTFSMDLGIEFATVAICSRFFINVSSNIATQYTAELLPTVIRTEGVAFINIVGYFTSIFSPFIAYSSKRMHSLPMIILGSISIFAAVICLFLPETLFEQLPQTLLDGELFGIDQKFWETPFTKKEPLEPTVHHLHAKRPATRPSIMRSSIISGFLGNRRRLSAARSRVISGTQTDPFTPNSIREYLEQIRTKSLANSEEVEVSGDE
ncbi:organic cation transporter protein [Ptiloglossa arizonensis]|uniref:organic cation transporter protein n=1 Tax=Ptiloglossa arizonensis TaxID=3350558 RepID=UPI003FA1347C